MRKIAPLLISLALVLLGAAGRCIGSGAPVDHETPGNVSRTEAP